MDLENLEFLSNSQIAYEYHIKRPDHKGSIQIQKDGNQNVNTQQGIAS